MEDVSEVLEGLSARVLCHSQALHDFVEHYIQDD